MAKQSHIPSRRAMLAGLAAAPVAGLPAIAGGAPVSEALAAAIDRMNAAMASLAAHRGPEDIPDALMIEDDAAIQQLVYAPCANEADLIRKLRVLLEVERRCTFGGEFEISRDGSLPIALEAFFADREALS